MAEEYVLPQPETLSIGLHDADTLISAGSGDAALLYLYILRRNGRLDPERAREISEKVTRATGKDSRVEKTGSTYRIKVGPLTEKEAADVLAKIRDLGYKNAYFTAG